MKTELMRKDPHLERLAVTMPVLGTMPTSLRKFSACLFARPILPADPHHLGLFLPINGLDAGHR
jgi:hypothetical protein